MILTAAVVGLEDENLPHCLRCLNSSRQCEGYDKPQVFINQVLSPAQLNPEKGGQSISKQPTKTITKFSTSCVKLPMTLTLDISREDLAISHLISKFPVDFAWRLPPGVHGSPLSAVFSTPKERTTVYMAGLCLAEAFYARAQKRHDLMVNATLLYSRSLQHLRQDLQVLSCHTSAAVMYSNLWSSFLLCLYEIVSGVSSVGWLEHCHGITALIVNFLLQRKHCFLETDDWKTIPWLIKPKSLGSSLQDLFCDVPGLMEDADVIMSRSTLEEDLEGMKEALYEKVENTMQKASQLRWQWEQDHADACKEMPSTDYSPNSSADPFPTVLHFSKLDRAIEIVFFNTLHLLLDTLLDSLAPEMASSRRPLGLQAYFGPFQNTLLLPGQGNREDYALEICRIVDFMSHCKHDSLGMFMLLFPLYVARESLTRRPNVCAWIGKIMNQLVREKGFNIGEVLSDGTAY
ncbi:hypothetical protein TRIATDRAFT_45794 [Trichoderma atroviride IMI 206040]|uniref:Zn(2)-C6 fungal-type domain-containing protein n=1 Tax=Hypocrea atroviridis (strain ATCC 20476 / IMI 206040) TaxID=452589 RepID=G9NQ88_HYPAI|nr:uncharacterized protein TRIATDRAFT_45794 [Trichoderma atroviride IMI 206040]EHK47234.1 hypothetical protein TRIATDRAFT_45794 [Trichoderma atroviride IMI 206040]